MNFDPLVQMIAEELHSLELTWQTVMENAWVSEMNVDQIEGR